LIESPSHDPPDATLPAALDAQDPCAPLREQFDLPPGVIYLDGNSLGVLPAATPPACRRWCTQEWGQGLIRSWNTAGWIDAAAAPGRQDRAPGGRGPGEVVATDSTSSTCSRC
jgi:kynureninase